MNERVIQKPEMDKNIVVTELKRINQTLVDMFQFDPSIPIVGHMRIISTSLLLVVEELKKGKVI